MLVFDHLGTKTLIAVMEYIYLTIPMLAKRINSVLYEGSLGTN